ncbi:MAG: MFS transporter [Ignavibacteria bacterium]|nr:MFS transporter [Ignavibacteria bacterium]
MEVSWRKNLYIIWSAQLLAMIGMSMVIPFLPLFVKDLGVTEISEVKRWSGLVVSGVFITAVIATPVWGWLGDRVGKKKMVLRAIFGLAVSQLLIGFSQDVTQLFIFRMVQGALSGFIAAALALVSSNTPKEKSGYAIGFLASSTAAGNLLGPFIGGMMADAFGYRNVFFITSIMCAVSGVLVFAFVKEINTSRNKESAIWDNYKFVFSNTRLKYALLLLIISAAAISMIQPLFALFIENRVGTTPYLATITGSIFGVVGLFQVISSSFWGKLNDRREIRRNLLWALIGAGAGYALHVVTTGIWELVPIRALLGLCIGGVMPSLFSFINKCIPDKKKGGVMGIASSFTMLGNLLGPLSSGFIASVTSIDFMFILSGVILAASSILAYFKLTDKPKDKVKISEKDKSTITEEIAAGVLD